MNDLRKLRPLRFVLVLSALCAALGLAACGNGESAREMAAAPDEIPQPTQAQMVAAGLDKLPVAPESKRLDIKAPTFSNPTEITNSLWPISRLHSVDFSGKVDGKPFHTETTLLHETRTIEWSPGQKVEALVVSGRARAPTSGSRDGSGL